MERGLLSAGCLSFCAAAVDPRGPVVSRIDAAMPAVAPATADVVFAMLLVANHVLFPPRWEYANRIRPQTVRASPAATAARAALVRIANRRFRGEITCGQCRPSVRAACCLSSLTHLMFRRLSNRRCDVFPVAVNTGKKCHAVRGRRVCQARIPCFAADGFARIVSICQEILLFGLEWVSSLGGELFQRILVHTRRAKTIDRRMLASAFRARFVFARCPQVCVILPLGCELGSAFSRSRQNEGDEQTERPANGSQHNAHGRRIPLPRRQKSAGQSEKEPQQQLKGEFSDHLGLSSLPRLRMALIP